MEDGENGTMFAVRALRQDDLPHILDSCLVSMTNVLAGAMTIDPIQDVLDSANAEGHQAWIVEAAGRFMGLAIVFIERESLVHLKWVSVAAGAPQRRQIRRALVEVVMRHTWESDCLKLIVHTGHPAGCFLKFMHAFGFDFSRERWLDDEHTIEFYRNLYERPEALPA